MAYSSALKTEKRNSDKLVDFQWNDGVEVQKIERSNRPQHD
jgi:hypothetical protein